MTAQEARELTKYGIERIEREKEEAEIRRIKRIEYIETTLSDICIKNLESKIGVAASKGEARMSVYVNHLLPPTEHRPLFHSELCRLIAAMKPKLEKQGFYFKDYNPDRDWFNICWIENKPGWSDGL